MKTLKHISTIVSAVLEEDCGLLKPSDVFAEIGVDSLGVLMVIVGMATEYGIDGTEDDIGELVAKTRTVGDVLEYVENYIGK